MVNGEVCSKFCFVFAKGICLQVRGLKMTKLLGSFGEVHVGKLVPSVIPWGRKTSG